MSKKIGEINSCEWESLLQGRTTIPVLQKDDFLIAICGFHQKGKTELFLSRIPNPNIPHNKQTPPTPEDWQLALSRAKELIGEINHA